MKLGVQQKKVTASDSAKPGPHIHISHPTTVITNKSFIVMSSSFFPASINVSLRGHQIIQIIEKDRFSLTPPLLKTGGQKKLHQKFSCLEWKLVCHGVQRRISIGSRDNPKKLKFFIISKK